MTELTNRPAWIDLSSSDASAARDFYSRLFGWEMEVSDDPQYGGYATAKLGDRSTGGIGPKQDPNAPSAWTLYVGSDDLDALAAKIESAGGKIVLPVTPVGDQGRFATFADTGGAIFSGWESERDQNFVSDKPSTFGWAELTARNVESILPFYRDVFGWDVKTSEFDQNQPPYHEFQLGGQSILGAFEMNPHIPAGVPNYWQIYFNSDDVGGMFARAIELGATEMVPPQDYPGGRFAILSDPQGASFGLITSASAEA